MREPGRAKKHLLSSSGLKSSPRQLTRSVEFADDDDLGIGLGVVSLTAEFAIRQSPFRVSSSGPSAQVRGVRETLEVGLPEFDTPNRWVASASGLASIRQPLGVASPGNEASLLKRL